MSDPHDLRVDYDARDVGGRYTPRCSCGWSGMPRGADTDGNLAAELARLAAEAHVTQSLFLEKENARR